MMSGGGGGGQIFDLCFSRVLESFDVKVAFFIHMDQKCRSMNFKNLMFTHRSLYGHSVIDEGGNVHFIMGMVRL